MRLLNTTTFELKDFLDESTMPKYAILSHTWGDDEIVFQDIQKQDDAWKSKASFGKISGFCSLAKDSGFEWCWADTLCIDKSSSAELSEAINSMFRWYSQSAICFAYLVDVEVDCTKLEDVGQFEQSRWHTRGWTLQELLAPGIVNFYDANWHQVGTKKTLSKSISIVTGIQEDLLIQGFDPELSNREHCVAVKMSWAANRRTSRVKDLAYCLLGIFDITMPLLYGEGHRAFQRLQLQILVEIEDYSLFAWKGEQPVDSSLATLDDSSLLAKTP